jgi:hypothetical protein
MNSMSTSNQYSSSKNRFCLPILNILKKVVSILIELDDLIKIAGESISIVNRSSKNMKFLRTGVVGAQLVDPEAVTKQMKTMIEQT